MSKLQDLIQKLCPNGVEYKKISECFDVYNGMTGVSLKWKESGNCKFIDYLNTYQNLKIDVSKKPFATVKNLNQNIVHQTDILLTTASEVPEECAISSVVEDEIEDNVFLDDHLFGLHLKEEYKGFVNTTYINYYMKTPAFKRDVKKKVKGVTRFFVSPAGVASIEIPVPPIEVQTEIAHILDNFSELTAELTAELQARQEQYEYYRDKLLSFNNIECATVTWMKMSEICVNICSGGTPSTLVRSYYQGNIPWLRTNEVDWKDVYDTEIKISEDAIMNSSAKLIPANCIIVAMYGATAAKTCINKIPLATNQACCNLQVNENIAKYKYVYYWLCSEYKNLKALGEGCQSNINGQKIKSYKIPIPPLTEQERIISILDKFDALVNDLSRGLPAEIAAVQEQYEYYRDKLLSFPRNKISA